jgi:hypothetical protein
MNTYALPALTEKRAKLAGRIDSLKRAIAKTRRELEHLDTTIKLFDPSYKVGSVKAKKHYERLHLFKLGELGRLIFDALRRAGEPLGTHAVADAIATAIGQQGAGVKLARRVRANLAYLERRGKVSKIGKREAATWRLAG